MVIISIDKWSFRAWRRLWRNGPALAPFHEEHLYQNLAWLAQHQGAIEQRLFRRRYGDAAPQLFFYDVTSSCLEDVNNVLAAFGYNRDGKNGQQQQVIGLHLKMEHPFQPNFQPGR